MSTTSDSAPKPRILIYLLRRDLRLADNPIFHSVAKAAAERPPRFTHLLPLYVFPAQQVEVSGFLAASDAKSPYPEARSQVGGFWRCGHHRVTYLAESVWDLKMALERIGSGLVVRVGMVGEMVENLVERVKGQGGEVAALWMTAEEGVEEKREERDVRSAASRTGTDFKLWIDEKYFVDDRDLPFQDPAELPDVFTSFRKMVEPLREAPRRPLSTPKSLLPLPEAIPEQSAPFAIPATLPGILQALHKPLSPSLDLANPPRHPTSGASTALSFPGGSSPAHRRIQHLLSTGAMTTYKDTRNGMLGADFSTKLSAPLALGSISARQVHQYLLDFEDGTDDAIGKGGRGYGKGENKGTGWVRFELLWRDYFRLCTRKFGPRLFQASGFKGDSSVKWKYDKEGLRRWLEGSTGMGLVDASQRELFLTGYTSNRARQNVASFLAKHLYIDWRLGAEWYECCLVDYDVSSNWGNWQYNAGVGNDPREAGAGRKFNPVKQTGDYDPNGDYIKTWCEELRGLDDVDAVAQSWKITEEKRRDMGLQGSETCERPLVKIEYRMSRGRGRGGGSGGGRGGARGRGGAGRQGKGRDGFSKRDMQ